MITVSILINGNPVYTRSAVNVGKGSHGSCKYQLDDGQVIEHISDDGAVPLAKRMLDTIVEVK